MESNSAPPDSPSPASPDLPASATARDPLKQQPRLRWNHLPLQWASPRVLGLISLMVLVLAAVPATSPVFPRQALPANAAADRFSAERALQHLPIIAGEPHPAGTAAQKKVTAYLVKTLTELGLEVNVQQSPGAENVVARLGGSASTGAVVILAHYDSVAGSPGAADNGSGAAALLEVARALKARPENGNDLIFLFDDSEELPDAFTGSKAFVREHPWMKSVRVAISLDTAVKGPVSIVETGPDNGWIVKALASAYNGGAWTSFSGGGGYDTTPFRNAGIMAVAMEDNYPFREKHTDMDRPAIVRAGSVQQMGGQALSIVQVLDGLDLSQTRGPQETFFAIPPFGFFHYPVSRVLPIAGASLILLAVLLAFALRLRIARLRGLAAALGFILAAAAVSAILITLIQPVLPVLFGWETHLWPDWPEVIPPNGGLAFAGLGILVLGISLAGYRLSRRWANPADYAMAALIPLALFAAAFGLGVPQAAYLFSWPVILASTLWLIAILAMWRRSRPSGQTPPPTQPVTQPVTQPPMQTLAMNLAAWPAIFFIAPYIPGIIMADGTKSLNILGAILALVLAVCLPAIDGLVVPGNRQPAASSARAHH